MRFLQETGTFFDTESPRRRLGWLWQSLQTVLRTPFSVEGRRNMAEFLFEVLRYIWRHFLVVVLLLLPVILLVGMPQGKDLVLNLLQSSATGGLTGYFVRVVWFLLMLVLLAYAVWAIPRFYQEQEKRNLAEANGSDGLGALIRAPSTSSDFLRVLAVLPLIFYGLAFIQVIRVETVSRFWFWTANGLIGLLVVGYALGVVYGFRKLKSIALLTLGVILCIPLGFSAFLTRYAGKPEFAYAVLGNGMLFIACLLFILFHRWEREFRSPGQAAWQAFLQRWSDRIYYGVLALVLGGALALALWQNTMCMTTIPVLVFFSAAYVLLVHLGLYVFMSLRAQGKLAMLAVLAGIAGLFLLFPSKAHYVYLVPGDDTRPTIVLDTFVDRWLERHLEGSPDSSLTIYLVAGEGGGSRAGFWTTRMLTLLDSASNREFSGKLLALSTVSGSSAGASAWLKWIRFRNDAGASGEWDNVNGFLARIVFANNYVTGGIIDLLTRDFAQAANVFTGPRRNNRNLRLQEEENFGFIQALRRQPLRARETFRAFPPRDRELDLGGAAGTVPNYHFLPLSALYYDKEGGIDTRIPLIFFNTTHMQTGRRGVAAPVHLDSTRFFHAIDVVDRIGKQTGKTLALGTANNLSELFPVFSAFSYLDSVGNFMDGGSYENKGLTTLLEMRDILRETLARKNLGKVRIVLIGLENGNALTAGQLREWQEPALQLPAMISQVATQPFQAHTAAAKARAEMLLNAHPQDTILFISLADHAPFVLKDGVPDSTRRMDFPLARDLSARTIDSMEVAAQAALRHILPLLRTLDPAAFSGEIEIERDAE